jgi:hypothetical protein
MVGGPKDERRVGFYMRKTWKKALAVLDGTPTGMRGQSMVELAITMPIFLIMLVGLVEVGWFANNYLILTDVVRAAGRYGSIRDPLDWVEGEEFNHHRLDCDVADPAKGGWDGSTTFNILPPGEFVTTPPPLGAPFYTGVESEDYGYYDGVACAAIRNMAPLYFNEEEDDIVVSVISYVVINNCGSGSCVRVAGRYPSKSNECGETVEPFDIDRDGIIDPFEDSTYFDGGVETTRGYVFRANQVPSDDAACIGSEFDLDWLENQLNLTLVKDDWSDISALEVGFAPNYGMVLVEMSWNSYQLLNLPIFSFVGNPLRIHVWGMFPVSAAEPDVDCWNNTPCKKE